MFDEHTLRRRFQDPTNLPHLRKGLRMRFLFMGLLNFLLMPFIMIFLMMYFFFKVGEKQGCRVVVLTLHSLQYGEEFHKNPNALASRQWSPYARWRFREFNELPHVFQARLNRAFRPAVTYVDQFPRGLGGIFAKFIAFVAGAFAVVFLLISIIDEAALLNLEITSEKSVLWYMGALGTVLAIARAFIPAPNAVFAPDVALKEVYKYTHYMPEVEPWSTTAYVALMVR